jgi:hypothetical protein
MSNPDFYDLREVAAAMREVEVLPPPPNAELRPTLYDVAFSLRNITYVEFVKVCEASGADPAKLWTWSIEFV